MARMCRCCLYGLLLLPLVAKESHLIQLCGLVRQYVYFCLPAKTEAHLSPSYILLILQIHKKYVAKYINNLYIYRSA